MKVTAEDLHIETDDNGFILGKSFLGDSITDEANVWREVRTDFSSLSLTRSVSVEKGVLFRPEAASLSLRTPTTTYMSGVFGRRIRVRWKNDVLFTGEIKSATLASSAGVEKDTTYMNITAVGLVEQINNYVLSDFTRPQETVAERVAAAAPEGLPFIINGGTRVMAARPTSNIKLISVLQEASDAQLARFYVDKQNNFVMDGSTAAEPTVVFSDDHDLPGHVCYRDVAMAENLNNSITGVVVEAKQDETVWAVNRHDSAVVTHEESYQIDVPATQADVSAWAESFPLIGSTNLEPSGISTFWQDSLAALELTHLVEIYWKGNSYRSGVKAIQYDITPDHENRLDWDVRIELMPGHLLEFTSLTAPSAPNDFTAVATAFDKVTLSWSRPSLPAEMTGYEVRVNRGPLPPVNRFDGDPVAYLTGNSIAGKTITVQATGLEGNTQYSYSLWATTLNPQVNSNRVTAIVTTPEHLPTAPMNFTVTRTAPNTYSLAWAPPQDQGNDFMDYVLYVNSRVDDGQDHYPSATSTDFTYRYDFPKTATSTTITNTWEPNQVQFYSLYPRTGTYKFGPGAFARESSVEIIPTAPRNVTATALSYNTIRVSWTAPAQPGSLGKYLVKWDYNTPPNWDTGYYGTTVGSAATSADFTVEGSKTYGYTVFPITAGGRYGPAAMATATTPQGIFSKYWEGEVSWSQSYKGDNNPSNPSSGFADDLYYGYGDSFNGNQRSMAGWNVPANVQGAYAIDRVELSLYNKHTWNNSGADAYFGAHYWGSVPASFQGGPALAIYHLAKPGWLQADVTAWLGGALKNGAKGITLGPAPSNSNSYYGYAAGIRGPRPVLKIWYRTLGS